MEVVDDSVTARELCADLGVVSSWGPPGMGRMLTRGETKMVLGLRSLMWAGLTAALVSSSACTAPLSSAPAAAKPTSAAADDAELTAARSRYYDAARQEGKLVIYGVGTTELYTPVKEAFEKQFPGITLEGVDQRGRETREKLLAEQQSGNYVADVAISGPDTQQSLIDAGITEDFQSAYIDTVVPELRPQYASSNPRSVTIFTIAANTDLVKPADEPKSWKDVLDPRWKGKLAMDDPRGSGPGGTIIAGVEQVLGMDWSASLAQQDVHFATQAGPLLAGLARGEYAMFLSSSQADLIAQKQQGAPFKQLRPAEGIGLTPISQSLIKHAPHPNAAKLWIDWSLSKQGQQLLGDLGYGPVRQGIQPKLPEASLEGTKILPRDDDKAGFQSLEERTQRWTSLFFK
jgi:iron(III) transport system substrate-binding protein